MLAVFLCPPASVPKVREQLRREHPNPVLCFSLGSRTRPFWACSCPAVQLFCIPSVLSKLRTTRILEEQNYGVSGGWREAPPPLFPPFCTFRAWIREDHKPHVLKLKERHSQTDPSLRIGQDHVQLGRWVS